MAPAKVVILGGGVVGTNAAAIALGMGADVTILEKSTDRMEELVARFGTQLKTIYSTQGAVEDECATADLVIGGVLIPGAAAPKLVTRAMLKDWKPGSVLVDVAIDQGAAPRPPRPPPMPIRPMWSTTSSTTAWPHAGRRRAHLDLCAEQRHPALRAGDCQQGLEEGLADDAHLRNGLNVAFGKVTYKAVPTTSATTTPRPTSWRPDTRAVHPCEWPEFPAIRHFRGCLREVIYIPAFPALVS